MRHRKHRGGIAYETAGFSFLLHLCWPGFGALRRVLKYTNLVNAMPDLSWCVYVHVNRCITTAFSCYCSFIVVL